jgi:RNA polymerase sigma-70 factor (ECF subfamily)
MLSSVQPGSPRRPPRGPAPDGPSDEELLAGYGASEPEASAAFVARFERRVFGLAISMLREPRAAEDVAQEAMLRAWRHAGTFDARRGNVTTWLLTITRNLVIDAVRARRAVPVDPDTLLARTDAGSDWDPSEIVDTLADVDRLRVALEDLPEEQRRAVLLAGIWGLTGREIAEREEIPLGTAKTRIRTALLRLRDALVDDEPDVDALDEDDVDAIDAIDAIDDEDGEAAGRTRVRTPRVGRAR